MAHTNQHSLFELTIEQEAKQYLTETARWGSVLAILGFIGCGLLIAACFLVGLEMTADLAAAPGNPAVSHARNADQLYEAIAIVLGIAGSAIAFFPCLSMLKFSRKLKTALTTNDQVTLNQSFKSQRILYRYVAIVSIIGVSLAAILIFFNLLGVYL